MYITNNDIEGKLNFTNTLGLFTPPNFRPNENLVTNKMPVELSSDLSSIFDNIENLINNVKYVQQIIDESEYDPLNDLAKDQDVIYHSDTGIIHPEEIPGQMDIDLDTHHSVILNKHILPLSKGKIGYYFTHEIYDNFEINSTLADILKIDLEELLNPLKLNIIHIKPLTTLAYAPFNPKSELDAVSCHLSLNGETTFWATTNPRNTELKTYSAKLSSSSLTAYNPYMLAAKTTTTENTYILNTQFTEMTFTKLLRLTNTK
jgi:hypothetical protein